MSSRPKGPNASDADAGGWLGGSATFARRSGEAADHAARADRHRPTDPGAIAAEIRRQVATGLRPRDVASAMRLDLAVVLDALRGAGDA